jgi:hypothetical protein
MNKAFMRKISLLIFYILLFQTVCHAQMPGAVEIRKYSSEDLRKDATILRTALTETHPGLYIYNSRSAIDHRFDSLIKSLNEPLTEGQFFSKISGFIAGIGCGHTVCLPSLAYKKEFEEKRCRYFPFQLKISGDRLFILRNLSTDSSIICGSEINQINGRSAAQIISILLPHIPSDGYNTTLKYHDIETDFMYYYAEFIEQAAWFQIQLKDPDDALERSISLPALTLPEMEKINKKRKGYKDLHLPKEKPLSFERTPDNIGILTIHSFDGGDIRAAHQHFHSFIRHAFDTMQTRGVNDLVIDLRNNGGGDDDNGWFLYSFLTDSAFRYYDRVEVANNKRLSFLRYTRQMRGFNFFHLLVKQDSNGHFIWTHGGYTKIHKPARSCYRGKVFILINGASFSATAEFSAVARYHDRVIFVGEETGGAYEGNNSGLELLLTLPNTHLRVRIPMMRYITASGSQKNTGHGVLPDYPVTPAIDDILKGMDTEKEFVLDLIRKKNCKSCGRD